MITQLIKAVLLIVILGVVAPLLLNAFLLWLGITVWTIVAGVAWIGWIVLLVSFTVAELGEL